MPKLFLLIFVGHQFVSYFVCSSLTINESTSFHKNATQSFASNASSRAFEEAKDSSAPPTDKVLDESDIKLMAKIFTKALVDIVDVVEANKTEDYDEYDEPVVSSRVPHVNDTIKVILKWSRMMKGVIEDIYKEALPYVIGGDGADAFNLSSDCSTALLDIVSGLVQQQTWAFRFLDAMGRIPAGFIDGTISDFGEYDECLEIEAPKIGQANVFGKYCLVRADFPLPEPDGFPEFHTPLANFSGTELENTLWDHLTKRFNGLYTLEGFRFGICIPSTCSAKEAENLLGKIISPTLLLPITVGPECDTKDDVVILTNYQKLSLAVYGFMIALVILASVLDAAIRGSYGRQNEHRTKSLPQIVRVILCFSLIRNTEKLFHVKDDRSSLSVVHGIRVLSIFWIIVGHTYVFGAVYRTSYVFKRLQIDIPRYPGKIQYQALNNAYLLVDSFFFVSGLVLMYVSIPQMEKLKGRFNYLVYVVHRWLRLTPALVGLILFIYLFPFFGNGPIFKQLSGAYVQSCEKNWWYDILYISNWYSNIPGMCAEQIWFIGADFQMYIFAPLVFLTFYRNEKVGLILNIALILIGMLSAGLAAYLSNISATFNLDHVINDDNLHHMLNVSYLPTYQHISPYCLGTLCGYLILKFNRKQDKWKIPILLHFMLSILLPAASLYAMFYTYKWNNPIERTVPPRTTTVLFAATQRTFWCLGIAWITFLCGTGKGGFVNDILSWKGFVPLSRLSFSIFLVHLLPILLRGFSIKYTRNWDDHTFLSCALMNTVLSCLGAYCLHILFEAPLSNLEKILLRRKQKEDPKENGTELSTTKNNGIITATNGHKNLDQRAGFDKNFKNGNDMRNDKNY